MICAPSLLAANFVCLEKQLTTLQDKGITWLHYDVMDGYFVPNHSFGADILKQIKAQFNFVYDVHLMVSSPKIFIDFYKSLADVITIHIEACHSLEEARTLIHLIQSYGIKAGISIKPNSGVQSILPLLNEVDLVLVMSVEPGFGGQAFMIESLDKVKELKTYKESHHSKFMIQIDGGVNKQNGQLCKDAGVENCVVGSYLFQDLENRIQEFQ